MAGSESQAHLKNNPGQKRNPRSLIQSFLNVTGSWTKPCPSWAMEADSPYILVPPTKAFIQEISIRVSQQWLEHREILDTAGDMYRHKTYILNWGMLCKAPTGTCLLWMLFIWFMQIFIKRSEGCERPKFFPLFLSCFYMINYCLPVRALERQQLPREASFEWLSKHFPWL